MANVKMLPESALTGGTAGQVLTRDSSVRGYGWADPQGGGGGGTSNYNQLTNKPQIGGVTLYGNKTAADLSLVSSVTINGASKTPTGGVVSLGNFVDKDSTSDQAMAGSLTVNSASVSGIRIEICENYPQNPVPNTLYFIHY